ncbi:unnamed protein product [Leptosia nina]|uniref:Sucrose-6-phosphate hydrolase n=1 Tax=Leptosia nina TaxID=320188 RepID=A0AAV1JAG3_9NEOP
MSRIINFFVLCCLLENVFSLSIRQNDSDVVKVEEYITSKKPEINTRYRLHYHLSPPVGWMNDPNGFSFFKGEFHMFYQFYPYDSVWGPMHWGHFSSPDLVHWNRLPTALVPGQEMCFSGSAVADGDTLTLIYTGREVTDEDPFFKEGQYLAFSDDGVTFHKYKGNPVLTSSESPDFRDPKVWKHGDYWYMVIGTKTEEENGKVVLYSSEDLKSWTFLSVIGQSNGEMGYMWECPDFFELNGKHVLLMSPQGLKAQGDRYKNTHQTGYIIGSFNYETYEFIPEIDFQEIDFGHDFYASQTTEHNGKRYLVAWFSMWEVEHPEDVDGWAGALTIIRELNLIGNRITMKPVDEITSLREEPVSNEIFQIGEVRNLPEASELIIEGELDSQIELLFEGSEGGGKVWLRWNPEDGKVSVDRGSEDIRQVEWVPIESKSWRIFLDASSLELFCGEGEVVFSTRVYPDGEWRLTNLSPQPLSIEAYRLKRSVPE